MLQIILHLRSFDSEDHNALSIRVILICFPGHLTNSTQEPNHDNPDLKKQLFIPVVKMLLISVAFLLYVKMIQIFVSF